MTGGARWSAVLAVAVIASAACGSPDRADREVVDRLMKLDVVVPFNASSQPSTSTHLGGGSDWAELKNSSTITVTYESALSPADFGEAFKTRFGPHWALHENKGVGPRAWAATGGLLSDAHTLVDVEARPLPGAGSTVLVEVSATRP